MKKLWISFAAVLVVSFSVLGWIGSRIYQEMPPLPTRIVDTNGAVVVADGDIGRGQNVWQALGGMEVGSIWGHGSYVAPDWTADWLHRESSFVLTEWSTNEYGKPYEQLSPEDQGRLRCYRSSENVVFWTVFGAVTQCPLRGEKGKRRERGCDASSRRDRRAVGETVDCRC